MSSVVRESEVRQILNKEQVLVTTNRDLDRCLESREHKSIGKKCAHANGSIVHVYQGNDEMCRYHLIGRPEVHVSKRVAYKQH